jgi:gliding motility-associated-like protein
LQGAKIIFDSIILQNPICRNDSNGKIIIYASGGQSPFLYATNTNAFSVNNKFLNQITGIYALHIKDANGCLADSTISIQPKNLFSVAVKVITPVTCVDVPNGGFTIALTATDTTINYIYQLSPTSVINVNGVFTNLQDGTYIVTVRDANGCEETTVGTIVDNSNPISVSFITKNVTCYGVDPLGAITANVIGGFSPYYFQWNNDSALNKNYLQNISAGTYTLQITDFNNCAFQDTVTVVSAPCCQLYIPNSFSPNDDGVNDVFIPITNATVTKYSFTIYNRWGNRVFFTSDISRGWDGKTKGLKSDVDTYFYLIDYYCPYSDKTYQLKGDVTLVK